MQIDAAADMMTSGTQDPNALCDAISMGIGFDATASTIGVAAPAEPQMLCGQ